jgi:threonine aldolase
VSLDKGIGALSSRAFVGRAAEWFRRQGGNVIHRSPYLVSAAMQFDARLAAMPDYFRRTRLLNEALRAHPEICVNPAQPAANMLHLPLPVDRQRALQIRTELALRYGICVYNSVSHQVLPDTSYVELYIGDNLLSAPDDGVRDTMTIFARALT